MYEAIVDTALYVEKFWMPQKIDSRALDIFVFPSYTTLVLIIIIH